MNKSTVLIVGAGPVGLVTACELRQQSIAVRVIDKRTTPPQHSRAAIIWPRQLELLRRIAVTSVLISQGHVVDSMDFYSEGRRKGGVNLGKIHGSVYPFAITIPQNTTESVLAERLRQLGGEIEFGTELVGIADVHRRPAVTLQRAEGSVETATFDWVVGADGAHSDVRRLLSIPFTAASSGITFGICDAPIKDGPSTQRMHYFYSRSGAIGVAPMRGGLFRIAMSLGPSVVGTPQLALFQSMLDERAQGSGIVGTPEWTAAFEVRFGTAEAFRLGSCFLAGDAAHIMSPAGGQGMNTGLQDAVNLGWKLASVIRGAAHSELLETYEVERRSSALRVTRTTGMQTNIGLAEGRIERRVRDGVITVADRVGVLQRVAGPILTQLDTSYAQDRRSPLRYRLHSGDRVPAFVDDGSNTAARSWPVLHPESYTLLLWPGTARGGRWGALVKQVGHVLPGMHRADLSPLVSPDLLRAFGRGPRFMLCRPDGHLATDGPIGRHVEAITASVNPFVSDARTRKAS